MNWQKWHRVISVVVSLIVAVVAITLPMESVHITPTGMVSIGTSVAYANPAFTARTETYVNLASLTTPFNITVTKPTGTVDGDILFCWIGGYKTTALTIDSVPGGWTELGNYITNSDKYWLYYKVASGEGANWVWSFSATAKVRAVCSSYTGGDFDPADPIDVVSNTAYRTSGTSVRAASMTVAAANSPLVFWGGVYSTSSGTFTKPSIPTTGWVENDDAGSTTPDFWTEVCSFIWSGSGATGIMAATSTLTLTAKHAFAVALNPPVANDPPATPTLADTPAFANLKINDTTPVLGNFSTTDPDANDVEYEIQWDDDYNFGSPVTKTSSNYPTDAGWTAATFTSGASTAYTVQAGDALTNGQTYWWQVRARDPSGSNTWSSYSAKRSFTIDTAITLNKWFQTTDEQFETGTLENVTTGSDSVYLQATTETTYDLNTSGATAWSNVNVDETADPHTTVPYDQSPPEGAWTQITGTNLANIQSENSVVYLIAGSYLDYTPIQAHFTNVSQDPNDITQMDFTFVGRTETSGDILQVWVWDFTDSQWDKVGTDMSLTTSISTYVRTQSSGFSDYINASDNMYILWVHDTTNKDLSIDYVKLTVTGAGASSGTITSTAVDYDWLSGATWWNQLSWTDVEAAGDIKYQVQYWDGDSWELIPDGDLSGNSAGFDESPVNLSALNTTTYNELKIKANLTDVSGTPYLQDWTISWSPSWVSYSDAGHTTECNNFYDSTNHVYMQGDNFPSGTTKVGYYDADGNLVETDTYIGFAGGTLASECILNQNWGENPPTGDGTWHSVVILTSNNLPATYAAAIAHPYYIASDDFYVATSAVPEFPTVIAGITVTGMCALIYWWMRRRVRRVQGIC